MSGLATNILELLQQRDSDELSDPAMSVVALSDELRRTEGAVKAALVDELEPAGLAIEVDHDCWCIPADPEDIGEAGWAEAEDAVKASVEVGQMQDDPAEQEQDAPLAITLTGDTAAAVVEAFKAGAFDDCTACNGRGLDEDGQECRVCEGSGFAPLEDAEATHPVPVNWQLLPPLTSDEYDALKEDIGQRGVLVPVEVDEDGNLLDGHHRMRAVAELRSQGANIAEPKRIVRKGWSDEQKRQHVYTINLARRALSREQKQEIAGRLRGDGWTLEAVARALGVSINTAHRWTQGLNFEIENQTITNSRGQERPATYAPRDQPALDAVLGKDAPEPEAEADPVPYQNHTETIPAEEPPAAQAHPARRTDDRQTWATPQALFDVLDDEFNFTLDAAADDDNHKCDRYCTAETDGLAQSWAGEVVYCNPPYGDKEAWVRKAWTEAAEHGALVVLLIPVGTGTKLWRSHCKWGEVRFITGRLRFDDGDSAAPFDSALVIFRPGVSNHNKPGHWQIWEGWVAGVGGE